jgi:hypothetical protein
MLPGHVIGTRQARLDPIRRGFKQLDHIAARVGIAALTQLHLHALARQPAARKHNAFLPAANALATLGDTIKGEFYCRRPIHKVPL